VPQYPMTPDTVFTTPFSAEERISTFLRSVYGWMCAGLAITALVAFFVASTPGLAISLVRTPFLMMGLVIAQLGLVFALSLRVQKMAALTDREKRQPNFITFGLLMFNCTFHYF